MHPPIPPSSQLHKPDEEAYRLAKPLPIAIQDHCNAIIDEGVWNLVFDLLSSTLTAGAGTKVPAHVPPPTYLALAATIAVHPSLTTRTSEPERRHAADKALTYLRRVNATVGCTGASLAKAFRFVDRRATTISRGARGSSRVSDVVQDESVGDLRSPYVGAQSLWTNAEDFWAVVGWAFNCSVAHKPRWERWRLWLDLMLDVLEDDYHEQEQAPKDSGKNITSTIIADYLRQFGNGRANKRRLMRALLADGSQQSLDEFKEVWKDETRPPKKDKHEGHVQKRRKLDLDAGDFGDYYDDSDEDKPNSRRTTTINTPHADHDSNDEIEVHGEPPKSAVEKFGGIESIKIRQRLMHLILRFGLDYQQQEIEQNTNDRIFMDFDDLLDLYVEFLRPLPLPVFQQFVLPSQRYLPLSWHGNLDQMLLLPLLEAAAPKIDVGYLEQPQLEAHFAPYAANGTGPVDNAKVSLIIEDLILLLRKNSGLRKTSSLKQAVERGIKARKAKGDHDGRRKTGAKAKEDVEAHKILDCSADRIRAYVDMCD